MTERAARDLDDVRRVWIVEDEPAAAALAQDLCRGAGIEATVFPTPLPFLAALRGAAPPSAVVLDWRLERELSAALFLATRHRYPAMPVVYWTGSPSDLLPAMIRADGSTRVVDKAAGARAFEAALDWATREVPAAG
ncbi:MAG TPA: response regulator [Candidatus Limnocylindria bacterium]